MNTQTPYPEKKRELELTPSQLATLLVMDSCINHLQVSANQLGGFLKLEAEGKALADVAGILAKQRSDWMDEWQRKVQLVQAIPNLERLRP